MTTDKMHFLSAAPCRWTWFAIIDPANPREWTPATISSSGLITTDYDIYYAEDPRLTYWVPLPDVPPVADTPFVRSNAAVNCQEKFRFVVDIVQAGIMLFCFAAALAIMFAQVLLVWVLAAPLATILWFSEGRARNRTWACEFVHFADVLLPANYYPESWQKYREE